MTTLRRLRSTALVGLAVAASGCASGALGDVLGGVLNPQGTSNERLLQGDVQYVDTNQQTLQVRMTNGQTANVRFDSRTQVVYQQQSYPVTALERGDQVSVSLQQTQQGEYYATQVLVTRSVQDANGVSQGTSGTSGRQYMQLDGTVQQVDLQRGMFALRMQNNSTVWVSLPYNAGNTTVSRFQRLRNGDYVRLGGYLIANDRVELSTFM
jgi:hypothetical protein